MPSSAKSVGQKRRSADLLALRLLDHYDIPTRRKFQCRVCGYQYSVTSSTIFASRKMTLVDLLGAICILVNAVKGVSALQMSRDLDCQYKKRLRPSA